MQPLMAAYQQWRSIFLVLLLSHNDQKPGRKPRPVYSLVSQQTRAHHLIPFLISASCQASVRDLFFASPQNQKFFQRVRDENRQLEGKKKNETRVQVHAKFTPVEGSKKVMTLTKSEKLFPQIVVRRLAEAEITQRVSQPVESPIRWLYRALHHFVVQTNANQPFRGKFTPHTVTPSS